MHESTSSGSELNLGFTSAVWRCDVDGQIVEFEGDLAFDDLLGDAHRRSVLFYSDVLRICLDAPFAKVALREFESFMASRSVEQAASRRLCDIVLLDGTFVRQSVICNPEKGISIVWSEVSDIRRETVKYKRQAKHDPLTGLLNRRGFELALTGLRLRRNNSECGTLIQMDLDNFKNVNDLYGHDTGDRVLIHTAESLRRVFGKYSVIGRVGGDEFVILLYMGKADFDLHEAADQLNSLIRHNEFCDPTVTQLGVSIGAVEIPQDPNQTMADLLRRADQNLYHSKRTGKSRLTLSEQTSLQTNPIDGFGFEFQPIVSTATTGVIGFEALLRNASQSAPSNRKFMLSRMNSNGLLTDVERRCFSDVVQAHRILRDRLGLDLSISINLCQANWNSPSLGDWLGRTMQEAGMAPSALRVELLEDIDITESPKNFTRNIQAIHDLGVVIDLDDFGLGPKPLEKLAMCPDGRIKIPRTYVRQYGNDQASTAAVDAIVVLARSAGRDMVAEGVETIEEFQAMSRVGVQFVQGYLFSEALSLEELSKVSKADDLTNNVVPLNLANRRTA